LMKRQTPKTNRRIQDLWIEDYWLILRRRGSSILSIGLLFGLLGFLASELVPKPFVSQAIVSVPDSAIEVSSLTSEIFDSGDLENIIRQNHLDSQISGASLEEMIDLFRHDIEIRPIQKAAVLISYQSRLPDVAQKVTEALVQLLVEKRGKLQPREADGVSKDQSPGEAAGDKVTLDFRVLQPASRSEVLDSSQIAFALLGFPLGCCLGFAVALGFALREGTVQSEYELERLGKFPVLASIPQLRLQNKSASGSSQRSANTQLDSSNH
jgi:uncharacterized protein involved in exopolysaccharide biosynthesis